MRNYRLIVESRASRIARREGAESFKGRMIELFQGLVDREMNGLTVAAIIEDMAV